jgi:hypothetical protein
MPFDWNQYLTLAKNLSTAAVTDEASLRSAVSRSYYAAFKLAMERAERNGYRSKFDETGGSHDQLWALYGRNDKNADCVRLGLLGPRMKRRRVIADYKSEYPKLTDDVLIAIENAEECVALIAKLPENIPEDKPRSWSV